jgi:pimeloyl-ACP methyl ester carboxylesterase
MPNPILYRRAEAAAFWRRISAAVLLISGGNSSFRSQLTDFASARESNTESYLIEGVGHMIHFEAPEILAAHIEQFLLKSSSS